MFAFASFILSLNSIPYLLPLALVLVVCLDLVSLGVCAHGLGAEAVAGALVGASLVPFACL